MKLPRKLVQTLKDFNSLLLRFDDGEVIKFQVCDDAMEECEPTMSDKYHVGAISRVVLEAWRVAKRRKEKEAEARRAKGSIERKLIDAWKDYFNFGEEQGFSKPAKLPQAVADYPVDWSRTEGDSTVIIYYGMTFTVLRPQ